MRKVIIVLILFIAGLFALPINGYGQAVPLPTTVEFEKNTNEFVHNEKYTNYITNIVPFIKENSDRIDKILLVGSASPEGNKDKNMVLANRRADRIYSFISDIIAKDKVAVNNDYELFLSKTGLGEEDFARLRATYIEIHLKPEAEEKPMEPEERVIIKTDTVYVAQSDTVYVEKIVEVVKANEAKFVFSLYNDVISDLTARYNIGIEMYCGKTSIFAEGSFSNGTLCGKNYNTALWHTGIRRYWNEERDKLFLEAYFRGGYFDTDLFTDNGKFGTLFGCGLGLGYKISLAGHWKICPIVRFGYDSFHYKTYYDAGQGGNINLLFGGYVDGKIASEEQNASIDVPKITITMDKTIDSEFYKDCYNAKAIYPSYIGLTIQKDFYLNKKAKRIRQ